MQAGPDRWSMESRQASRESQEDQVMVYEIGVHDVPAQWIVSVRQQIPRAGIPMFIGQSFGLLFGHLTELGVAAVAPPFVVYHAFGLEEIDAEVCVPIKRKVIAGAPLRVRRLQRATVARTTHVGPYEALGEAYQALDAWVAAEGRAVAGPVRERYLTGPDSELAPDFYRTEIELPISEAPVAVPV